MMKLLMPRFRRAPAVLFPREDRRLEYLLFTKTTSIGIGARQMQEELIQRLGRSFDFFGFVVEAQVFAGIPIMLRMATDDATKTDIIMFSLGDQGGELPQAVKKWINSVIDNSRRRVSLLALLETGGAIAPQVSRTEIFLNHLFLKGWRGLFMLFGWPAVRQVHPASRRRR